MNLIEIGRDDSCITLETKIEGLLSYTQDPYPAAFCSFLILSNILIRKTARNNAKWQSTEGSASLNFIETIAMIKLGIVNAAAPS